MRLYLDTSVPNAYFDEKNLIREEITRNFWLKLKDQQIFISDLVNEEIKIIPSKERREKLLNLIKNFKILDNHTIAVKELAEEYVIRGIIPVKYIEDASHIAVVTINYVDVLVSWNFEHIVKLKTKREINVINVLKGYPQIEIIDPEMF